MDQNGDLEWLASTACKWYAWVDSKAILVAQMCFSLEIAEVVGVTGIDDLMSVVESYPHDSHQITAIRNQLLTELNEVGDNRIVYVGRKGDLVVAMIQIILKKADNDPDLANGRDLAHAHNLQVRSELQGKGIGRQMMVFVEDIARKMQKTTLTLGVDDFNERAITLYKKLGYEVFKIEPGRTSDEKLLAMRKCL